MRYKSDIHVWMLFSKKVKNVDIVLQKNKHLDDKETFGFKNWGMSDTYCKVFQKGLHNLTGKTIIDINNKNH